MLAIALLAMVLGALMAASLPVFALLPVVLLILAFLPPATFFGGSIVSVAIAIAAVQFGYFAGSILWNSHMRRMVSYAPPNSLPTPAHGQSRRKFFGGL